MAEIDLYGLEEADIISQVNSEYDESIEFTMKKRELFKKRDSLYLGIEDSDNKVYVRLVYAVVDTLLALETGDKRSVIFQGRKFGMDEYSDNINAKAKYDYEQMGCFKKKYFARQFKYLKGVRIEAMDSRDPVLECPTYKVVSPDIRCPDWFQGINNGPRYHGFEYKATRREVENNKNWFNQDQVMTSQQLDELTKIANNTRENRELSTLMTSSTDVIDLYYHYTIFNGRKYMVVLGNERSLLLYLRQIPAITDIEKKDPSKIEFPVITGRWRPLANDPFGISVPDLLEDKQTMMQLFLNLNKIKAEHEALGDMFLFDPDKVDVENLKIPTLGPKYVPVSGLAGLNTLPMSPVQKGAISPDAYNMPNILKSEATLGIGMDERTLGVGGGSFMTATENQRVQANANLRLMLGVKWDNEAEKQFRGQRYRYHLEYFEDSKEKFFRLNDGLGQVFYSVKKKDFMGLTDIDIEIVSQNDVDEQKAKAKNGYMIFANMMLADPNLGKNEKAFIQRKVAEYNDISKEEAIRMVKPSAEEITATLDLELLNRNQDVGPITNMDEDHWTYIVVYQRAFDTDAKRKAISKRMLAMELSGQNKPAPVMPGEEQSQQSKANSNMLMNNMIQGQGQQATSLDTISQ